MAKGFRSEFLRPCAVTTHQDYNEKVMKRLRFQSREFVATRHA